MMAKAKPKPVDAITPVAVVEATEMVATTHEAAANVWKNSAVVNAIIAGVVTLIVTAGTLGSAYIQLLNNRLQAENKLAIDRVAEETKKASVVAQVAAEEVKKATSQTTTQIGEIKESTDETRAMGNHQMEVMLELYSGITKRVADQSKDPVDINIADRALKKYNDHVESQEKFNAAKKEGERKVE